MVAKIAMQAADLYADALSNMQVGSIKSMWDKVRLEYPFFGREGGFLSALMNDLRQHVPE